MDFKKHTAVISYFRQHYIATGLLDKSLSDMIGTAFIVRNQSDYEDFYVISKARAVEQYDNAKIFCSKIEEYLKSISD